MRILALLLIAGCSSGTTSSNADAGKPAPPVPQARPTASAEALNPCDAHRIWFDDKSNATPEEHKKAFTTMMKAWTPECRRAAFDGECGKRCDTVISDMIVDAAATNAEKRSLVSDRVDRNAAAQKLAESLYKEVASFLQHAQATAGVPRDVTPECMARMRADFATIDALTKKIDASILEIPIGAYTVNASLGLAKGCVDCSQNRAGCTDMMELFKDQQDNLKEWQKELDADPEATRGNADKVT